MAPPAPVACLACRRRKARCPGPDSGRGDGACASCAKRKVPCEWQASRRNLGVKVDSALLAEFGAITTPASVTGSVVGRGRRDGFGTFSSSASSPSPPSSDPHVHSQSSPSSSQQSTSPPNGDWFQMAFLSSTDSLAALQVRALPPELAWSVGHGLGATTTTGGQPFVINSPMHRGPSFYGSSSDPFLDPEALPLLQAAFFNSPALPLLHRPLFLRCHGSVEQINPHPLGRVYRHPVLMLMVLWIGMQAIMRGPIDLHPAYEKISRVNTPRTVDARLQALVKKELGKQMTRLMSDIAAAGPGNAALLMTQDNLAVFVAAMLSVRAFWFDDQLATAISISESICRAIHAMGVIPELIRTMAANNTANTTAGVITDPVTFLYQQEWLKVMWSALQSQSLMLSSYRVSTLYLPPTEFKDLPLPVHETTYEQVANVSEISAMTPISVTIPPSTITGGLVGRCLEAGDSRELGDYRLLGQAATRYIVGDLMSRVHQFPAWLKARGLTVLDLIIAQDLTERSETSDTDIRRLFDNARVARNPELAYAMERRRSLLRVFAAIEATFLPIHNHLDKEGNIMGMKAVVVKAGKEWRGDIWAARPYMRAGRLILLGMDQYTIDAQGPPENPDEWTRLYSLSTSLLTALDDAFNIAKYAKNYLVMHGGIKHPKPGEPNTLAPPFWLNTVLNAAWSLICIARWIRLTFAHNEQNREIAQTVITNADICLKLTEIIALKPDHERLVSLLDRERTLVVQAAA